MGNFVELKELEENDKDGFGNSEEKAKEVVVNQVGVESNEEIFEEYDDAFAEEDYESDDFEYDDNSDEEDDFDDDIDEDNFDISEEELNDLEGDEQ